MQFPADEAYDWKEKDLQEAATKYLEFLEQRKWLTFQHSPLESMHTVGARVKLKKQGTKKGHPDLDCYIKGGKTVFFELKTWTGVISDAQIKRSELLGSLGFDVHFILSKSPSHCINQIAKILREEYGVVDAQ